MKGTTWIADYLNQENFVVYSHDKLVFHSIVHNSTGKIMGDAPEILQKYGLYVVPHTNHGTFEGLKLIEKIQEISTEIKSLPISKT